MHLGYEEYLNERGWSFPRTQLETSLEIFENIFRETGKVKKIIFLGDMKHYFAGVLKQEFREFYSVVEMCRKNLEKNGEIVIIKGNHDNILEPILARENFDFIRLVDSIIVGDVLFIHGAKKDFVKLEIFDSKIKLVVIGHFHPAIAIERDTKKEKYKCFLFGKSKELKKNMIIVPSFFPLVEGTDILHRSLLEDRIDISRFKVFILSGEETLDFGQINKLKR